MCRDRDFFLLDFRTRPTGLLIVNAAGERTPETEVVAVSNWQQRGSQS